MCQHLATLLVERVLKVREDQIREAGGVSGLKVQSWKNCLNRINLVVEEPPNVWDTQVEKPVIGSGGAINRPPTSASELEFDVDARPFSP